MPAAREVWVEIGFGGGEHLAGQAALHPDVLLLGAEPFVDGQAKLVSQVEREGLANVRIHPGDARELLAALPDASADRVFILFPDPWPKTRHHKRRLIQPEFVAELARVLKPGGGFASPPTGRTTPTGRWSGSCARGCSTGRPRAQTTGAFRPPTT